jgi:hypothetical protein
MKKYYFIILITVLICGKLYSFTYYNDNTGITITIPKSIKVIDNIQNRHANHYHLIIETYDYGSDDFTASPILYDDIINAYKNQESYYFKNGKSIMHNFIYYKNAIIGEYDFLFHDEVTSSYSVAIIIPLKEMVIDLQLTYYDPNYNIPKKNAVFFSQLTEEDMNDIWVPIDVDYEKDYWRWKWKNGIDSINEVYRLLYSTKTKKIPKEFVKLKKYTEIICSSIIIEE